ncbi:hypothetical protein ARTHRO9AX_210014 [Arthrobacter sp. 9AX]|nr:hypothetical protein ARTHRO9AX_210014 [Arthrobacter sp. 9AX]
MQYLSDGEGSWTELRTEQLTDSYNDVKRSLTGYRLSGAASDRIGSDRRKYGFATYRASGGFGMSVHHGTLEVLVHGVFGNPVGAAEPHRRHLPRVDKAVNGHFGDAHDLGYFSHGKELRVGEVLFCRHFPIFLC